MKKKTRIYLADLTHTGASVVSSEIFPLASGLIGAYLLKNLPDQVEVELFKFPENLTWAIEENPPDIIGFTNYSWNLNLSYEYAQIIKQRLPDSVVLFGGVNYDLNQEEVRMFWKRYPLIDFCVIQEGEAAALNLLEQLLKFNLNVERLKATTVDLPNCHYLYKEVLIQGSSMSRLPCIEDLPSPYLMGLMDKFFEYSMIPLTHTTRGCPFRCGYCIEGMPYYNKVLHRKNLSEELEYIAQRVRHSPALYFSDANFGMYSEDINKAKLLAEIQNKYGYPKVLFAATGKNKREHVIEVAKIIHGAMFISTAIQTTDKEILKNIERDNIDQEVLTEIAEKTKELGANTYTELILALPGDSIQTHRKTLRDSVESGQGVVRMYQLIMLPQTKLNSPENIEKFQMKTRYRVMPRSYGRYRIFDQDFICVESEKICVGNATMTFEDYLECRELDLSVEILHNGSPFIEFGYLCQWLGLFWFDFLMMFHEQRRQFGAGIKRMYDDFRMTNIEGYWEKWEDLQRWVTNDIDEYLWNKSGTNEMSCAKGVAFFQQQDKIHEVLEQEMKKLMVAEGKWDDDAGLFFENLLVFCQMKKKQVFDFHIVFDHEFQFDVLSLFKLGQGCSPREIKLDKPKKYEFFLDDKQKAIFGSYSEQYGTDSIDGLGRILMRSRMEDIFRQVRVSEPSSGVLMEKP